MVEPNPMSKTQTLLVFKILQQLRYSLDIEVRTPDKNNNKPKLTDKQIFVEKGDLQ